VWPYLPRILLILIDLLPFLRMDLLIRFVITVAPQNDICPHGRIYPINVLVIVKNRITTPTDHVCMKLYDP